MTRKPSRWTNPSIALLDAEDPVEFIIRKARSVTLEAMAAGWSGPPFDQHELARHLGIDVAPLDDIPDARIRPLEPHGYRIEFNPHRSRGRTRYSIAHEIAHTFFPDCAKKIRNRDERDKVTGDSWQLELLCNIAASELVMPIGSFPDLREEAPSIDHLMTLRRDFDVSIEALMLRYIRLTRSDCALFSASTSSEPNAARRYRIDYAVCSRDASESISIGYLVPESSVVSECTAIGFTAKGTERWLDDRTHLIECVGAPPFPGSSMPRVLGLALPEHSVRTSGNAIVYLRGNALEPRGSGRRLIVHVMNNRSKTWGGGFARAAGKRYPEVQADFRRWASEEQNQALGQVHFYGQPQGVLAVATIIAQKGFGRSASPRISYPHLEDGLKAVAAYAVQQNVSVHMPRIGCGQAGGNWEVVAELIDQHLAQRGIAVTVYDLPD